MSVVITEGDLKQAYAEIEALREEKRRNVGWDDELYEFCVAALGDPKARNADRVTWEDIAHILNKKGWMEGSSTAIKQAFQKERRRRELNEGE